MKFVHARFIFPPLILSLILATPALALDDNVLGLYYDAEASVDEIEVSPNSTHSLYLVLLNPVNENYDGGGIRDVEYVSGFECAVEHPSADILLGVVFPAPTVNIGSVNSIVAGFATAVPVSSRGAAMLATFSVLTMGNSPEGYRLVPTSPSSLPNVMVYVDSGDPEVDKFVEMMPVSGSYSRPVFTFGDYSVEQNVRWGEVKSLYR